MILNAQQIRDAVKDGRITISCFDGERLEAASYDLRVGDQGITTTDKQVTDIRKNGLLCIQPGDFAVVTTQEEIILDAQHTGRFGLRSKFARKGLLATTGPQIDPGFHGRLILGLTNLAPKPIALSHNDRLVSVEFHRLSEPTERPYSGPFQGKMELGPEEIEMVSESTGMAYSEVLTTLQVLTRNVASLSEDVKTLSGRLKTWWWLIPLLLGAIALGGPLIEALVNALNR